MLTVVSVVAVRLARGSNVRRIERKDRAVLGLGVGGGSGGRRGGAGAVMQPQREPKLVVSSTHISPDAAGIHMSILVPQVPAGCQANASA